MSDGTTTTDTTATDATAAAATTTDTTKAAATTDSGKTTDATTDATKASDAAKAADATKTADATKAAADAPVDYGKVIADVPMPDGMKVDPVLAKLGGEVFAKHKISPEAAKDLVALFANQQKAGADGNAKAFSDQVGGWKAEAEKSTTAEERGSAKEAALKLFGKDEVAVLDLFGVTNRAAFIKSMARISKAIKDDTFVPGNAGAPNGSGDARKQFPNSNMNP